MFFGIIKDPELILLNFRGQLQCRMSGKRQEPIEEYPNNFNPLDRKAGEISKIPAWTETFELVRRELSVILQRDVLPTAISEFPIVRRMTL